MLIRRYLAAWVLMGLALFFNAMHYYLEVVISPAPGTRGYWLNTTVENLQSEVWQIALAAYVFQHFLWVGSPEAQSSARNSPAALVLPGVVVLLFLVLLWWATPFRF